MGDASYEAESLNTPFSCLSHIGVKINTVAACNTLPNKVDYHFNSNEQDTFAARMPRHVVTLFPIWIETLENNWFQFLKRLSLPKHGMLARWCRKKFSNFSINNNINSSTKMKDDVWSRSIVIHLQSGRKNTVRQAQHRGNTPERDRCRLWRAKGETWKSITSRVREECGLRMWKLWQKNRASERAGGWHFWTL